MQLSVYTTDLATLTTYSRKNWQRLEILVVWFQFYLFAVVRHDTKKLVSYRANTLVHIQIGCLFSLFILPFYPCRETQDSFWRKKRKKKNRKKQLQKRKQKRQWQKIRRETRHVFAVHGFLSILAKWRSYTKHPVNRTLRFIYALAHTRTIVTANGNSRKPSILDGAFFFCVYR